LENLVKEPAREDWTGRIVDGRYRLMEKLGEGGMGQVYRVEHVRMGKVLAMKLLRRDLAVDRDLKNRFHHEAQVVSRLSHPNTIQVFDFGDLDDGSLYFAMEYLPGRDLSNVLRSDGAFSEERVVRIGLQVLASLAEAHEQGIIHRDIKPGNIMWVKRREDRDFVKVLDFGIAGLQTEGRKLGSGEFIGTPAYMSPEQARAEELDCRSDLYSVAAMLFELAAGRPPFVGENSMEVVSKHINEMPPRLSEVAGRSFSPAFEQLLSKALSKDRHDRPLTAEKMRAELQKVRRDVSAVVSNWTPAPADSNLFSREDFDAFERRLRRRRVWAPALAALMLAGAGFGGFEYYKKAKADRPVVVEREPNDELNSANLIALGQPVSGNIGVPLSDTASDRDIYVVKLPKEMPVSVEISGVPDMNLVLELSQLDTRSAEPEARRFFLDDAPAGEAERVDGYAALEGKLYIRVEERRHYTEPPRRPRENTRATYSLTVRAMNSAEPLEVEPNDTPETATRLPPGKSLLAFSGASIPYSADVLAQPLSSGDFFTVAKEAAADVATSVIIVPPPTGTLLATDVVELDAYRTRLIRAPAAAKGRKGRQKGAELPPTVAISGKPELVPLGHSSRKTSVRIQPAERNAPAPGAAYGVAFVTAEEKGLDGALMLARWLLRQGRGEELPALVQLLEKAFPDSPQLTELKELPTQSQVAKRLPANG
jgi:serine/threonine-protein kinase